MGLAFFHNPDWLATADLPLVWDAITPGVVVTPSGGYLGGGLTGTEPGYVRKAVKLVETLRFAIGCRIKIITLPATPLLVLGVTDPNLVVHCSVALQPDGSLTAHRGLNIADPPLRWLQTGTLNVDYWTRIGFEGTLSAYLGALHIYVQGQTSIAVEGVPTVADDGIPVQGGLLIGVAPQFVVSHYYMTDWGTTGRQGLLKDLIVQTQRPSLDGKYHDFIPVGAPTLTEVVDDVTPDADVTYAQGTGVGKLSFVMAPTMALPRPIYGTRITSVMKLAGTFNERVRMLTVVNGKAYPSENWRTYQQDAYLAPTDNIEVNPSTRRAWKMAELNSSEAGVQLEGDRPWFIAGEKDRTSQTRIQRFDPRFWLVNFNRPMVATIRTVSETELHLDATFYTKGDLAGLIWESLDRWDHVLLKYGEDEDYSGVEFSFHWTSSGMINFGDTESGGPVLTIEGQDESGAEKTWYVRLIHYADGNGNEANVVLNFDSLYSGWDEFDPKWEQVYPGNITRIFFACIPPDYEQGSSEPLDNPMGAYLNISNIEVRGSDLPLYADRTDNETPFLVATGFDDHYNITPERLLYNAWGLGYRRIINHYIGMSHYYELTRNADTLILAAGLNVPCRRWHENFYERAKNMGYEMIISMSYELFNEHAPDGWKQRDVDGLPALTGWEPPSTLLSPTNPAAMGYLQAIAVEMCGIADSFGLTVRFQVGEPWWWVHFDTHKPYFYDFSATQAYTNETGLTPPPMTDMTGPKTPTETTFMDWLGVKLGNSTHDLKEAVKSAYPGSVSYILFYAPQVMTTSTPDMYRVNRPAQWHFPEWDIFQLEDYDFVIAGEIDKSNEAAETVTALMGYPVTQQDYFSGFVLNASDAGTLWPRIYEAAVAGMNRGVPNVYFWATPQIMRDNFVVRDPWAGRITQVVREVAFSEVPTPLEPLGPCVGQGVVPPGVNPLLGANMALAVTPLIWVEFAVGGGLPTPKRVAKVAINYAQRKEPRIIAAGSVTRAVTDTGGFLETAAATVTLNDTDREIRRAIEVSTASGLYNRDAFIYMADKSTIAIGGPARRVFYGKIKQVSFPSGFQVELVIEDIFTFEKSSLAGDTMFPKHMIASSIVDDTGGNKEDVTHWPAPLCYGGLTDEDTEEPIGVVPTTYIQATSEFEELGNINMFFVCLGVVKEIQSVYGANVDEEGDAPTSRVRIPEEAYGDWLFVPGKPGWPSSNPWYESNGKRYTVIMAKDNPISELARSGRIPFVVNVCGYEDVGDGSGSMIASLPRQLAHFLINFVLNDYDGDGNWQTAPPLVAGGAYSALDMTSFETAKIHLDNALGRTHTGAFMLGHSQTQVSFDTLIAQFMTSLGFNARLFINRHGQIALTALDRYYDYQDAIEISPARDIATGIRFEMNGESVENVIQYAWARRYQKLLAEETEDGQLRAREPVDTEFISGIQKAEDFLSQAAQERDLKSEVQAMEMVRIKEIADVVVQQRLDWMKIPRILVDIPLTSYLAADLELGQVVKVTHEEGIDHLGWTRRRCMIERIVLDLDNESSSITVRDLYDLIPDVSPDVGDASSRLNIGRLGIMRLNVP